MKEDGGTAFPSHFVNNFEGMSLRDWFAGMAMQGIWSSPREMRDFNQNFMDQNFANIAGWSYEQADAMILELGKKSDHNPTTTLAASDCRHQRDNHSD